MPLSFSKKKKKLINHYATVIEPQAISSEPLQLHISPPLCVAVIWKKEKENRSTVWFKIGLNVGLLLKL